MTRACNQTKCDFQWFTSQWSNCSVDCGKGIQTRAVHCAQFDGTVITPTKDESKCDASLKPEGQKECNSNKECEGQWFAGPWSDCSKECGGGDKSRKVLCLSNGQSVAPEKCGEDKIVFAKDECNKDPCVDDELIPVDTTANPITEDDEGEEYCDEDDDEDTTIEIVDTSTSEMLSSTSSDFSSTSESSLMTDDLMLSDSTDSSDSTQESMSTDSSCNIYV